MIRKKALLLCATLAFCGAASAQAKVRVVAAENFYGDVATQIGGNDVTVSSIMSNPDQDPHLFEASPATARLLAAAQITIANGVDYDPWMVSLLRADRAPGRVDVTVASLVGKKVGDNPHLWYDPATMSALAMKLASVLGAAEPAHKGDFAASAARFETSLKPVNAKIAEMRAKYSHSPVTASEPVFGYMAKRLGLVMRNARFQLAVMNNTEPSASDVAAFENDLKNHKVKVMIYNSQADDEAVKRLVAIAKQNHVPLVGVTETEPAGETYQTWMLRQLNALDQALSGGKS